MNNAGQRKDPPHSPGQMERKTTPKSRLVLQAARSCFLELGYDRTSMDLIAQKAGVSKATVYAHFESKEALLYGLIEEEFEIDGPPPLWDPNRPIVDIAAALTDIAHRFTAIFLTDKKLGFHRLIMTNASHFPAIAEIFMNGGPRRHLGEVRTFLEQGIDAGLLCIDDLDLAAKQFLSLVQGDLPLNWALSMQPPEPGRYEALIEGGVRVFLAAYGVARTE